MNLAEKEAYKQARRGAVSLFRSCEGVLPALLLLCYGVKKLAVFPLMSRIWSLVLCTLPQQFVTERNITVLLTHPYVLLVGLVPAALFAFASVWEISAVLLCLEYYRQGKPVGFLKLLLAAAKRTWQIARPGNWLFFVYLLLILPLTDLYSASGMLDAIAIPEYISDFLLSMPLTALLLLAVHIGGAVLAVRWFYTLPGVVLGHRSFGTACRESARLMKGRYLRMIWETAKYMLLRTLRLCVFPALGGILALSAVTILLEDYGTCSAALMVTMNAALPLFAALVSVFTRMAMMCWLAVSWRVLSDLKGGYPAPELFGTAPGVRKLRSWRAVYAVLFSALILLSCGFYTGLTALSAEDPEFLTFYLSDTKLAAHKGYSAEAPENTMDAFGKACESEYASMIELDIRESKDGIPIVIHNASLSAACGVNAEVYDLTYEEIRACTACYGFYESEFPDAYIPTLAEVLETYGNRIPMIIEIKADARTPDLPAKIVDLLNEYGCKENCVIHSGSYEALEAVKALDPTIPCGYIVAVGAGSYYSLPCADFFSVEHTFVNQDMLDKVHALGKQVYAWTVNDASSIVAMAALDVDVIITDDPDIVHEIGYSTEDDINAYFAHLGTRSEADAASTDYEAGNY